MAEKLTSPSTSGPARAGASDDRMGDACGEGVGDAAHERPTRSPEQPPRPDVTLALLRDDGLELAVCHADDRCAFEILNLTVDPLSTWDEAVRIAPATGSNWRPINEANGVLLLERAEVERLSAAGEHTLMIRQVSADGQVSVQSLFRIVDWGSA